MLLKENVLEKYLESLLSGDRTNCRGIIEDVLQSGIPANRVYMDIIWPTMVEIDGLYRQDRINSAQEAFASRINRTIVNQLQNKLPRRADRSKKILVCTASSEKAELGGQMLTDFFESDGWETRFVGGSVDNDDVLTFVHNWRPDILLLYGLDGKDAPRVRQLIDSIRAVNAFPQMRIMLSGGVFGRAEGLWEEIGADIYAEDATEAVHLAGIDAKRLPTPERTIKVRGRNKKEEMVKTEEVCIS